MIAPATASARYLKIQKALDKNFPDVTTALNFKNPLELLVATIMSAQCTDVLVNKVTAELFKKYKTAADYSKATPAQMAKDIYPVTFYQNKAKSLVKTGQILAEKFAGKVPQTLEEMITLPGAARKTANVVLGHAYKIASGVVVDTHVIRTTNRLGLTINTDPKKIEMDLIAIVPQKNWIKFSDQLIHFGRTICTARINRCCEHPDFKNLCLECNK